MAPAIGGGTLLGALDYSTADGPWDLPQDFRKISGLVKYSRGATDRGFAVTAMGYDGQWDSTDQIPERAVGGQVRRFHSASRASATVDPTTGGESHRYSLSVDAWSQRADGRGWSANAYAMDYHLELISNFTYALDQVNGDQFEQYDDRRVYGGRYEYAWPASFTDRAGTLRAGVELRRDEIEPVGLFLHDAGAATRDRTPGRRDADQHVGLRRRTTSAGTTGCVPSSACASTISTSTSRATSPANSGTAIDSIASPKATVVLGPWRETEYFVNAGRGFHSNDARGTTIRVDPTDGVTPVDRVDPLVAATGAEIGFRTAAVPGLQIYGAFWGLELDSELLFVGDGGITEPSRESRRYGVELGVFWTPLDWLILDVDYAWSHAALPGLRPGRRPHPGRGRGRCVGRRRRRIAPTAGSAAPGCATSARPR